MLHSDGLRQKNYWYEEWLLVPFILQYPDHCPIGTDDLLLSVPDIFPNLLCLCGLARHAPRSVSGSDLSAQLRGSPDGRPESALYLWLHWRHNQTKPYRSCRGVRKHRYTYVEARYDDGRERWILHDSWEDPYQLQNLATERAEVTKHLHYELWKWLEYTDDAWLYSAVSESLA